jgi:hypothetical protein
MLFQKVTEEVTICISIILLRQYYKNQMGTLLRTDLFLWQQCCIVYQDGVDRIPLAHRVLTFVHNYCKIMIIQQK